MRLEMNAAREAIETKLAEPLNVSMTEAAAAIYEVVNSNMTDAIHVVTVQKGYDPREFVLVAAGGASPIHTGELATSLRIKKVIVPKASSVFCALGGLQADMKYDFVRTYLKKMSDSDPDELAAEFRQLTELGISRLHADHVPEERRLFQYSMDMRYIGQHWDIPVHINLIDGKPDLEQAVAGFHRNHEGLHGYRIDARETEIVNLRVMAIGRTPSLQLGRKPLGSPNAQAAGKGRRQAYFGRVLGFQETSVYDGPRLQPGNEIVGPAIIEEPTTTIVIAPDHLGRMDGDENIIIHIN
jgi:N-methylhydantoinase A